MRKHYAIRELVRKESKLDMLRDQLDEADASMVTLIESEIKFLEEELELLEYIMEAS